MNFRQFAFNNVKRNLRAYSAYFLSSAFAVMIFFSYALLIYHPALTQSQQGKEIQIGMKAAAYVIFVFAFLFVLYSISAFLKSRNKEFGILTILGAKRQQINQLIFQENILIGFAAIVTGIICGLACSKLLLLYGANVIELKLPFYFPIKAIGLTVVAFSILYIVITFLTLVFIRQQKALELLMGANKPKKEPYAHILLVLLSIGLIASTYYVLSQKIEKLEPVLLALTLGSTGTYFFFTQFSVYVMRLLKRSRSFFWRGTRMLWISEMTYKLKDNSRMFFMVTIVIIMASSAATFVHALGYEARDGYNETPFAISFLSFPDNGKKFSEQEYKNAVSTTKKIDQELETAGLKYEKAIFPSTSLDLPLDTFVDVIKESDYHPIAKSFGDNSPKLRSGEAILIDSKLDQSKVSQLGKELSKIDLKIVQQIDKRFNSVQSFIVVNDETYKHMQMNRLKNEDSFDSENLHAFYHVPDWSNQGFPRSDSTEAKLSKKLGEVIFYQDGSIETKAGVYLEIQERRSMMSFIGIFMIAVFSLSAASFLYFKLYTDLDQDQRIYHMLSRIGLSVQEMRRTCTIQIAMLFFIPTVVAGLVTISVMQVMKKHISDIIESSVMLPASLTVIVGFLIVQTIYFLIVRALYLRQMDKAMVESMH
ncbi:putative ABC transport system permease protein [Thermoactinomyces sp. DSM 45891]|uniref:FtsX-like permease family protein n=1 Tax=Thermoactinomyces sp. DSM 45891 TaxID=1761907 RepID=UPI0009214E3F|nr:ABC transporter permease [Thermoactinomyces sp. DSM 45891]SFX81527.1 putative ABC transport system permease protein [Thermoactinomyces sp. DSM 45891]